MQVAERHDVSSIRGGWEAVFWLINGDVEQPKCLSGGGWNVGIDGWEERRCRRSFKCVFFLILLSLVRLKVGLILPSLPVCYYGVL